MRKPIDGFKKSKAKLKSRELVNPILAGEQLPIITTVGSATFSPPNPPITGVAEDETKNADVESRGLRLVGNLIEQKHELIGMVVSIIGFVILILYITFIVTIWCLFNSQAAFRQGFPVTAVVLVGMTGSVPTILSISLLLGLFSHKDGSKDKDEKAPIDAASFVKIAAEVAKFSSRPH